MTDKLIKDVMAMNEHFYPQLVEGQKLHASVHAYVRYTYLANNKSL